MAHPRQNHGIPVYHQGAFPFDSRQYPIFVSSRFYLAHMCSLYPDSPTGTPLGAWAQQQQSGQNLGICPLESSSTKILLFPDLIL